MSAHTLDRRVPAVRVPWHALAVGVTALVPALALVAALVSVGADARSQAGVRHTTPTAGGLTLGEAPASLQEAAARAFEADAYLPQAVASGSAGFRAVNAAQDFEVGFADSGVSVTTVDGAGTGRSLTLSLQGYGEPDSVTPVQATQPVTAGDRVEYRRGALTEWYRNDTGGVEQGFTLHHPPAGRAAPQIALTMRPGGDLLPRSAGAGIDLVTPSGERVLTYDKLLVVDADDRELPAFMRLEAGLIELVVDTRGARYPIVVDPLIAAEQTKLIVADPPGADGFGHAVALQERWAVVGAPLADVGDEENAGAVYVFLAQGPGEWMLWQKLTAADATVDDRFGWAIDIDGDTIVVGAPNSFPTVGNPGAKAYIFTMSGLTASFTQTQRLSVIGGDRFGESVAIDGDTVAIGAPQGRAVSTTITGAAHVYVQSGATWTMQQKLTASDAAAGDRFGHDVDVDGDTVVIGAPLEDAAGTDVGATYVFGRSAAVWTQQQKLSAVSSGGANADGFGTAVAVDGTTVLVGAPDAFTFGTVRRGTVYAYTRPSSSWVEQDRFRPAVADFSDFGSALALDGDTAVVGTTDTTLVPEAPVYVFSRSAADWTETAKVTPADGQDDSSFGHAVALDGSQALAGAILHDNAAGTNAGAVHHLNADGGAWVEDSVLLPVDALGGNRFGTAVDLHLDRAVVGAPATTTTAGRRAGAAYVFRSNGAFWHLEGRLVADDAFAGQEFGRDVAVGAGTILVGATQDEADDEADFNEVRRGAAYAFRFAFNKGEWVQQAKLTAPDAAAFDAFGARVEVHSTFAVVTAPMDDNEKGTDAGAAYVLERRFLDPFDAVGTWMHTQKLVADDGAAGDQLGWSTAYDGTTLAVGAPGDDDNGDFSGAAYAYRRTNQTFGAAQKLTAPDGAAGDRFAELDALAVDGDTLVAGARFADLGSRTNAGAAYVFSDDGSGWAFDTKLTASDGVAGDAFGVAVAVEGQVAVVGAGVDTDAGTNAGGAYVFTGWASGWAEHSQLTASDGAPWRSFGGHISMDGSRALIGSTPGSPTGGLSLTELGSGYVFTLDFTNSAPTVSDVGNQTTPEDTGMSALPFSVGDVETDAEELEVTAVSDDTTVVPDSGIVLAGSGANRTVTVTPAPDASGTAQITLTVTDEHGGTIDDSFDVTVTPVPDAPIATDDAYGVDEDDILIVDAPGVLANDTDADGDVLAMALIDEPQHGVLTVHGDYSFAYRPAADFSGTDGFTYRASDGTADSGVATATITVRSVNDVPVAAADTYEVGEDGVLHVAAPGVLANDGDAEGSPLTAVLESAPAAGDVTLHGDGSFDYSPTADVNGTDTFTYRADDGTDQSSTTTVSITVHAVNDAPLAVDDEATTDEDAPVDVDVAANDSDADGSLGALLFFANGQFATGAEDNRLCRAAGAGGWSCADISGEEAFSAGVASSDLNGDGLADTVFANQDGAHNQACLADGSGGFTCDDVGADDRNSLGVSLSDINGDGHPDAVFANYQQPNTMCLGDGAGAFTCSDVSAGGRQSQDVALGDANGDGLPDVIVANDSQRNEVCINDGVGGFTCGDLGTDAHATRDVALGDVDGDGILDALFGTASVSVANQLCLGDGSGGFACSGLGTALFTQAVALEDLDDDGDLDALAASSNARNRVCLNDGAASFACADVSTGIRNAQDVAVDDVDGDGTADAVFANLNQVDEVCAGAGDGTFTCSDIGAAEHASRGVATSPGMPAVITIEVDPAHGAAAVSTDGTVTYTPAEDFFGADAFTYRICDGDGGCDIGTVSLTVNPVPDAPVANGDSYEVDEDQSLNVAAPGVLDNDTDADGDALTAVLDAGPSSGDLTLNADGSFTYIPDGDFVGEDTFTYHANDATTDSEIATVSITVRAVNDPPVIVAVTCTSDPIALGTPAILAIEFDDADSGDSHSVSIEWGDTTTPHSGPYAASFSHSYAGPGVFEPAVVVTDSNGASSDEVLCENFVVVYDPDGGFVSGGGWFHSPAGAYPADGDLAGPATFGFVSKYQKGKSAPTGTTDFRFAAAGLEFSSNQYDWLVIAGSMARYRGTGSVNGEAGYQFFVVATDGDLLGGDGTDKLRVRIWREGPGGEETVYDNQAGDGVDDPATTSIGGGSIVVHEGKGKGK